MQELAWNISIWLMVVLAISFIYVVIKSGDVGDNAEIQASAGRIRPALFWILLIAGGPITFVTLADLPYNSKGGDGVQVVKATGFQWYWEMSTETVKAGTPVEFQVTADDVNHGFAVYDSDLVLLTQTQAMPGYINKVTYTFDKPGKYQIMCLEYCGLTHHSMTAELTVVGQ